MRVLHAGYKVTEQMKEDERKGIKPGDRERFEEFKQEIQ